MEAPGGIPAAGPQVDPNAGPQELPLLPIMLEDWLASNGGLTRLKLKLDNATANQIASEVKQQTGVEIVPDDSMRGAAQNVPHFSVEAAGQPFWEAVSQWNRVAKPDALRLSLWLGEWNSPGSLGVTWQPVSAGRALNLGPCRLMLSSVQLSHSLSRSLDPAADPRLNPKAEGPEAQDSLSLTGSLRIDPRLAPRIEGLLWEIREARDDTGQALKPDDSYDSPSLDGNPVPDANFSLSAPVGAARRLSLLRGVMRLAVLTKSEPWEIPLAVDPTATLKAQRSFKSDEAQVSVRFDGITAHPNGWSALFHLERKEAGPRRVFKSQGENGQSASLGEDNDTTRAIRLLASDGHELLHYSSNSRSGEENGARTLDIEVNIERNGEQKDLEKTTPAKIIIDIPLEWREVQIPFEFKDLPLP